MISAALDPRGSLWDNLLQSEGVPNDLTFALWKALAETVPQRCWSLLERFSVSIAVLREISMRWNTVFPTCRS